MSRSPIFLLLAVFSFALCSQQFDDHFDTCFAKLEEWYSISLFREGFGEDDSVNGTSYMQCLKIRSCFFDLTQIGTPEEMNLAEIEDVLVILKKMCNSLKEQEISYQNLVSCIGKTRPEFFTLKKNPNHLSDNCEFTPNEMAKLDVLVLQKCGLRYQREFKKQEDNVRTIPCMKEYGDMNKFFV